MYGVGGALAVIAVVLAFALADRGGGSANVAGAGSRVTEGSSALPRPTYDPSAAPTWNPKPMAGVALPALRTAQYPGEPASYVMEDQSGTTWGPGGCWRPTTTTCEEWHATARPCRGSISSRPRGIPSFCGSCERTSPSVWSIGSLTNASPGSRGVPTSTILRAKWWSSPCPREIPSRRGWLPEGTPAPSRICTSMAFFTAGGLVFGSGGDGIQGSGFYFRPPGGPTTALDGHGGATPAPVISQTLGDQWIDTESGSIIYRIPGGQSDDQSAAPVAWYRHDIASDSVVAIEPAPREPPAAKDGCSGGYVVGGWLVENCSGAHGTWLVDPTGAEPAMIYDGATPGWLGLEYGVDGASLGLEGGWGQLVRALPAP